ncbi:hypothetical protein ACQJBY_053867 [Aegilops geniculata]
MVREAIARLLGFRMSVLLSHHCMRESSRCQLEVSMCTRPNLSMTDRQSLMEKRHLTKRWMPDSCSRLQSGQSPQLSQPRRSNRSAVQFQSCKVNQAKNLTLGGPKLSKPCGEWASASGQGIAPYMLWTPSIAHHQHVSKQCRPQRDRQDGSHAQEPKARKVPGCVRRRQ